MNNCCFVGRLVKDPELKKTESGYVFCRFSLAVDREDKDRNTDFFMCSTWGKKAEFITSYFKKGSPVAVTGKMILRNYETEGQKRSVYELVVNEASFVPGPPKIQEADSVPDPETEEPGDIIEF